MATLPPTVARVLRALLAEAQVFLTAHDERRARASLDAARQLDPNAPGLLRLDAELAIVAGDLEGALVRLRSAVERAPDDADVHHALARLLERTGEREAMIRHDLEVLRLDAAADRRAGIGSSADLADVEAIARRVLDELPEPFASRLADVPVILEPRPHREVVAEGFDPRALGLFEGPDERGRNLVGSGIEPAPRPTRIVLFYANLLAETPDADGLAREVEITILHEVAHYFGLDEDEVDALGLA